MGDANEGPHDHTAEQGISQRSTVPTPRRTVLKSAGAAAAGFVGASVLSSDPALERGQCERLAAFKADRDMSHVESVLDDVVAAARGTQNLMYPMKDALRANATLGEVSERLMSEPSLTGPLLLNVAVGATPSFTLTTISSLENVPSSLLAVAEIVYAPGRS